MNNNIKFNKNLKLLKKPLVTIITPAYNQAEFLEATMRSVLEQNYPALEYIVIDDGSKDDSLTVANRVAADYPGRVTVLSHPNCGQASTLNKGWELAKGEILGYLSSDDCLLPDAVSRMVDMLQANPDASVAYCDFWIIDSDGHRLKKSYTEDFNSRRLCVDLVCQPGPGAFLRRQVFDKIGGWNPNLHQVPDFEFWLRAVCVGPFIRVPESLAEYRIHESSASFRVMSIERAEEIVRVVRCYWSKNGKDNAKDKNIAIAKACNLAAKNHAQSGRIGLALYIFFVAIRKCPSLVFDLNAWRQIMSGILRRTWYALRASLGKISG